jgi:uncharacterized protein
VTGSDEALVFPVAGLLGDAFGSTRTIPVGPVALEPREGLDPSSPLVGELRLGRTNRGLVVRADVATSLATTCSRCLRPIDVPIRLTIDEEVLPSVELSTGAPVDTEAEPEAVRLTDHHELDIGPLVWDAISLAEPIAPLCRPDCPGLCEVCGADLASPGHVAHETPIDQRLEALRAFKVDAEGETD